MSCCLFANKSLSALTEDTSISQWEAYQKITELEAFLHKQRMIQGQVGITKEERHSKSSHWTRRIFPTSRPITSKDLQRY